MRRAAVVVAALVLVVGGALVLWRLTGPKLLRFPYLTGPARSSVLPGFEVSTVEVEPGVQLRVVKRAPKTADAKWLVFFPGNDEAQLEQGMKLLTRLAGDADVGLATFAYRGFDGSGGMMSPATADVDAKRVVEASQVEPSRMVFVAFSLGAPVATHLAAKSRPSKLVLLAGASALAMLPQVPWARAMRGDVYEVGQALRDVRCPVEVFHGETDSTLPQSMAEELAQAARTKAVFVPGATHVSILERVSFSW
jgi:pimeloyl-ACP methyl ester carboxylesterase